MNTNQVLIESYLELLGKLGNESKLEIISRLADSMKERKESGIKDFYDLYGAFEDEKSAEEMIEEIRNSRNFNRQVDSFD
ncbi:MAG: hypothetical protein H6581_01135 [Bacteroidia bacterium]|nr:hypothetical protein [Bacteroidia bacterium]